MSTRTERARNGLFAVGLLFVVLGLAQGRPVVVEVARLAAGVARGSRGPGGRRARGRPRRAVPGVAAVTLVAAFALFVAPRAQAQTPTPLAVEARALTLRADSADVRTVDGIVRAFYETISGPVGQPRQWARDSTLYYPGHRFVRAGERGGRATLDVMPHGAFVAFVDSALVASGFLEEEVSRVTHRFGNVAHVWSTYEWRVAAGGTTDGDARGRGVNSLQLAWDGERWWITSAAWDSERPGNPLPPEFTPGP